MCLPQDYFEWIAECCLYHHDYSWTVEGEERKCNFSRNLILIIYVAGVELIQSPTWLLHGDQDTVISQSVSLQLMQKLTSPVEMKVIENGSHWLFRPEDIKHLLQAIDSLLHPTDTEQDDD